MPGKKCDHLASRINVDSLKGPESTRLQTFVGPNLESQKEKTCSFGASELNNLVKLGEIRHSLWKLGNSVSSCPEQIGSAWFGTCQTDLATRNSRLPWAMHLHLAGSGCFSAQCCNVRKHIQNERASEADP